ncbi:FAS1 domain [Forsythia ovata]|uniref:FAS1 domain n=1 Tax=Forsythia ovata TaxID=205694 RepID=A0ABD1SIE4_9LAMI
MSGFHFSSVPKFKIRRGRVVDDIFPLLSVPSAASYPRVAVLQTPEITVGGLSFVCPAPEATSEAPLALPPVRPVPSSGSARQSGKRKTGANSREEASRAPHSPPPGKCEYINIGSRRDQLDPVVLGKLLTPVATAVASVHKYWTSAFGRAVDNAELTELLKLAEMYTSRSHVLNYELYKLLEVKIDELRSTARGDEDVEALRAENKDLREQLAFSEEARVRATYDVVKARTIHRACVDAQKTAESQLKSCQNMIYAKDKELTEALSELSKAQGLLAKLGVAGYAEPQGPSETSLADVISSPNPGESSKVAVFAPVENSTIKLNDSSFKVNNVYSYH